MAWLSDLSISGSALKQVHVVDNPLLATLSLFRCPELRGVELVALVWSFEVQDCWRLRKLDGRFECPTLVNVELFSTSLTRDNVARRCPTASEFQVRKQLSVCVWQCCVLRASCGRGVCAHVLSLSSQQEHEGEEKWDDCPNDLTYDEEGSGDEDDY
jgi:hypothetical protein